MINIFQWIYNLISSPSLLSILILLIATIVIILHRWRSGVILVFVWLYLEDIIRRLLPGQPPQVMLIKDGLLLLTYFAFFAGLVIKQNNKNPFILWRPPFLTGLLIFGGLCVVQSFNPNLPNLSFAAIGLRSYLWYMPILFLGYYMFSKEENLIRFCRILVYTSIPLAIFAVIQYIYFDFMSPLIRPFEGSHHFHSFILGQKIKFVPSVFGASSRYATLALLLFFLGMGLQLYPNNSLKQRFFINISILFAAIGVFISGVRTPMYLLIVGTLGYMLAYKRDSLLNIGSWRKSILLPITLLSIVVFLVIHFGLKDIGQFLSHYESLRQRPATYLTDMSFAVKYSGLLGLGTGSRGQGLQHIPGGAEWTGREEWGVEGGIAKIWYEFGPVGELIFIFFFAQMFLSCLRELRKLKETTLYSLGFSIYLFPILMFLWYVKAHMVFADATLLVCFWFFMGVLFRLKDLNGTNGRESI